MAQVNFWAIIFYIIWFSIKIKEVIILIKGKKYILVYTSLLVLVVSIFYIENMHKQKEIESNTKLLKDTTKKTTDLDILKEKNYNQIQTWGYNKVINSNVGNNGTGVKVAILDSGVNKNHEDLKGQIIKEINMINPKKSAEDNFNHGTAIAGIIAAKDNNIGIKGIASGAKLYSVKILDENGDGTLNNLIKGIDWAIQQKVDIMNLSFGLDTDNPKLKNIIDKAVKSGIIIVAASGNNYIKNADYPARYENVISVGSIDENLSKAKFSSIGKIEFSAPGKNILSTDNKGNYSLFNGTSFSAAYITGLIALYISNYNRAKNSKDIINSLKENTEHIGSKNMYGYGILEYK